MDSKARAEHRALRRVAGRAAGSTGDCYGAMQGKVAVASRRSAWPRGERGCDPKTDGSGHCRTAAGSRSRRVGCTLWCYRSDCCSAARGCGRRVPGAAGARRDNKPLLAVCSYSRGPRRWEAGEASPHVPESLHKPGPTSRATRFVYTSCAQDPPLRSQLNVGGTGPFRAPQQCGPLAPRVRPYMLHPFRALLSSARGMGQTMLPRKAQKRPEPE